MNRYKLKKYTFSFLKAALLLLLAFIILFPFWQLIVSSLLETNAIISYPPKFWPTWRLAGNYLCVFTMQMACTCCWMLNSIHCFLEQIQY